MISRDNTFSAFISLVAPLVWRNEARVAAKFRGFSATEAGSALDMLKAAELEQDPQLRKLFFRHALDETRHSNHFRDQARRIDPDSRAHSGKYDLIHATRQNLYQQFSLIDFIAFVYLAEKRGEAHFRSLLAHFKNHPEISEMFEHIVKDEKFHLGYTKHLLDDWARNGRRSEVRAAIRRIRINRMWGAWRRSGRRLGDFMSRLALSIVYFVVLPLFSLMQRLLQPAEDGRWKKPKHTTSTFEEMEQMF